MKAGNAREGIDGAEKQCTRCKAWLPATRVFFHAKADAHLGLCARCKTCRQEIAQTPRARAVQKNYRHSQKRKVWHDQWRKKREADPIYRARMADRRRRLALDPEYRAKRREYYRGPKARARQRRYQRERRKDRGVRLNALMQNAILHALKRRRLPVKAPRWWEKCCRYTAADLKAHLEAQFAPDMTWENHGAAWEIDHIIPLAAFHITEMRGESFREAWALANLRPLPKALNRAKGAKSPD